VIVDRYGNCNVGVKMFCVCIEGILLQRVSCPHTDVKDALLEMILPVSIMTILGRSWEVLRSLYATIAGSNSVKIQILLG